MKRKKRITRQLTPEEEKVREWIRDNRGILTQIAVAKQCCHQFVQQVAYGRSTTYKAHQPIEDALRLAGWPGITRRR